MIKPQVSKFQGFRVSKLRLKGGRISQYLLNLET
jgi:hypothetical protein